MALNKFNLKLDPVNFIDDKVCFVHKKMQVFTLYDL